MRTKSRQLSLATKAGVPVILKRAGFLSAHNALYVPLKSHLQELGKPTSFLKVWRHLNDSGWKKSKNDVPSHPVQLPLLTSVTNRPMCYFLSSENYVDATVIWLIQIYG